MCVHMWVGVGVGRWEVGVCYSTPLNCVVLVIKDVQVFLSHQFIHERLVTIL